MSTFLAKAKDTFFASTRILKIYWQFDKKIFLGHLITVTLPMILSFVNALVYKSLIDLVIASVNGSSLNYLTLYYLLAIRIATLFIQDGSHSLQTYYNNLFWTKFPIYLYQEVLGKMSSFDVQLFENSNFKDKMEKVKNSYSWKPQNMISSLFYGFSSFIQVAIALVAVAYLNWYLLIPITVAAIFSLFIQTRISDVAWGIWSDASPHRKKYWYLTGLIEGGSRGESIKEIKIFQLASKFLTELKELYSKFEKDNLTLSLKQFGINLLLNFVNLIVYASLEIYVILSAIARRITIGEVTYYTTIIVNFQNGINGLFRNISSVYEHGLYVKDMFDLLDIAPVITSPKNAITLKLDMSPKIEFINVSFRYPDSTKNTLTNFSLTIEPGQKVALVGENGAGKSTIIKLLARFYDVNSGEILVNGHNLKDINLDHWHKSLGILFQDFIKYEYPLSDNIYFGKVFKKKSDPEIIDAAKQAGADLVAKGLPNKYEQMLGKTFEDGVELSSGQWQKVALAKAFLRNAPILVLDEPTASIDAKAEFEIFQKVEKLSKSKTVIIISHRFSTVRNADKIYVINGGSVSESGSHEELVEKNGVYKKLFELQARGYK